eukprot:scaffold106_cov246-Pinguiococcus_pyrenoidosus.AAC.10
MPSGRTPPEPGTVLPLWFTLTSQRRVRRLPGGLVAAVPSLPGQDGVAAVALGDWHDGVGPLASARRSLVAILLRGRGHAGLFLSAASLAHRAARRHRRVVDAIGAEHEVRLGAAVENQHLR